VRVFQDGVICDLQRDGPDFPNDTAYDIPVEVPQALEVREIARAFGTEAQWFDLQESLTAEQHRDISKYAGAYAKFVSLPGMAFSTLMAAMVSLNF